jgi:hypothetical protein
MSEEINDPFISYEKRFTAEESKEIVDGFKEVIKGHEESKGGMMKDFQRGQKIISAMCKDITTLVENFIVNGIVPKGRRPSDKEIEDSVSPNKPFVGKKEKTKKRPD